MRGSESVPGWMDGLMSYCEVLCCAAQVTPSVTVYCARRVCDTVVHPRHAVYSVSAPLSDELYGSDCDRHLEVRGWLAFSLH